ncbi:TPA: hypothetical protein ACT5B2_000114 [Burkholderia cenocepacia]
MANIPNGQPSTDANGAVLTKTVTQTGNLIPNGRPSVDENGALLVIAEAGTTTPQRADVQIPRMSVAAGSDVFDFLFLNAATLDFTNSYWSAPQPPSSGNTAALQYEVLDGNYTKLVGPLPLLTVDSTGAVTVAATTLTIGPRQWLRIVSPSGQVVIPQFAGCISATLNAQ